MYIYIMMGIISFPQGREIGKGEEREEIERERDKNTRPAPCMVSEKGEEKEEGHTQSSPPSCPFHPPPPLLLFFSVFFSFSPLPPSLPLSSLLRNGRTEEANNELQYVDGWCVCVCVQQRKTKRKHRTRHTHYFLPPSSPPR